MAQKILSQGSKAPKTNGTSSPAEQARMEPALQQQYVYGVTERQLATLAYIDDAVYGLEMALLSEEEHGARGDSELDVFGKMASGITITLVKLWKEIKDQKLVD